MEGLLASWEQLQTSGRPINTETVWQLAQMHGVTTGKWMFWASVGAKADILWSKVATGVVTRSIPAFTAKISSYPPPGSSDSSNHVCCIYNKNFLDKEEVFMSEQGLRAIGLKCKLVYKPDVYTHLNIYRQNPWGMRPTIYSSTYNIMTRQSTIEEIESIMTL